MCRHPQCRTGRNGRECPPGRGRSADNVSHSRTAVRLPEPWRQPTIELFGGTIDLSRQLVTVLLELQLERKAETLHRGWREMPPWVFCSTTGTLYDHAKINKAFVKAAGLPPHFT
jgi:hypothetical protein